MRNVTPAPAALPDVPETPLDEETAGGGGRCAITWTTQPAFRSRWDWSDVSRRFTEEEQAGIYDVFGDAIAAMRTWRSNDEWLQEGARQGAGGEGHGDGDGRRERPGADGRAGAGAARIGDQLSQAAGADARA